MNRADPRYFFVRALQYSLKNEGGYVDNPSDSGGPTKCGITLRTLSRFLKTTATIENLKSLNAFDVSKIYETLYWNPLSCNKLNRYSIATAIFDMAILFGQGMSAIAAQRTACDCGMKLTIDGEIGPNSISALNRIDREGFIRTFHGLFMERIAHIIEKTPENEVFKNGWENRVDRLITLIKEDVA